MRKVDLLKAVRRSWEALPKELKRLPVWVAVSGGGDSTALASVSLSLRPQVPALAWIHVNYGLRGRDADREEAFLRAWAKQVRVPLRVRRLSPRAKPPNLQAWAREQRLRFFSQVLKRESLGKGMIWLAHHEQDQAETVLLRLIRGTGLNGLGGMKVIDQWEGIWLFRPFLSVPKEAIQVYLRAHDLKFFEDRTNRTGIYLRNRIRHRILPLLEKENPRIKVTLNELAQRMGEAGSALEKMAQKFLNGKFKNRRLTNHLSMSFFKKYPQEFWPHLVKVYFQSQGWWSEALGRLLPRIVQGLQATGEAQTFLLKKGKRLQVGERGIRILRGGPRRSI